MPKVVKEAMVFTAYIGLQALLLLFMKKKYRKKAVYKARTVRSKGLDAEVKEVKENKNAVYEIKVSIKKNVNTFLSFIPLTYSMCVLNSP